MCYVYNDIQPFVDYNHLQLVLLVLVVQGTLVDQQYPILRSHGFILIQINRSYNINVTWLTLILYSGKFSSGFNFQVVLLFMAKNSIIVFLQQYVLRCSL